MPDIKNGFHELQLAVKFIKLFARNSGMEGEAYSNWSHFLIHLQASWDKVEAGFADTSGTDIGNKFNYLRGLKIHQRKKDPLLKYLWESRNMVVHGVGFSFRRAMIDKLPAGYTYLSKINKQGIRYDRRQIPVFKTRLLLNTVINKERKFQPPTHHLGVPMENSLDPIEIAIKGISFYFNYIKDTDVEFTRSLSSQQLSAFWTNFNIAEVITDAGKLYHIVNFQPEKENTEYYVENTNNFPITFIHFQGTIM
ncbi:hypothetical protein SAMN05192529_13724 [Arachidicoccus rhizosphaerae]|uniref:Uncharacterized protein n=1 Tax=Arachidicoccus rhizosphaerae TaxID=551991 RepID=A0A1H4CVA0_9BACT|nr:hypothetical protein [Arachidicoccus rhizosphaerae]SEA64295.1 hypothetical protein SAMN05192529_13724 [Arachidicoccus rhizosphaerae]